ncbi:type 1 glutamine amidotransferase [Aeromicrobium sp. CTD01-1L150]|uniref:type 1 glutamine amidotransferase n=1 Tax=Aeromicrobium sp. CTD01-1L150 TaxID=3341830 RepID=UPI0035BFD90B
MRTHVVADETDREGGHVTERLAALGLDLQWLDRDELPAHAELEPARLLLLLGSQRSAHEPRWQNSVTTEESLVRASLRAGTPVMGICFGAQVLARALGGTSYRGDEPEVGWKRVDTIDGVLCPEGPWAQFHRDVFAPPQQARVLGTTWYGPQCFTDESLGAPAIGWQFHPEVTPQTYARWVDDDADTVRLSGADPTLLKRQALANAGRSRVAAHTLVDAALRYLEVSLPERA